MTPRVRCGLLALLLVAAAVTAHAPALTAGFTWDDHLLLLENPLLRDGAGLHAIWFSSAATDYYPVTWSLLWLLHHPLGANPAGYHLVNLLLHAAGAVLLWRVLRQLQVRWAWLGALLFAVHPVTVASVAWVSQLKNTLSLVLYLGAGWSFLHFDRTRLGRWYALTLLLTAGALLSKSSTVVLPMLLLLALWWRHGRLNWRDGLAVLPVLALALLAGLAAVWFQNQQAVGLSNPRPEGLLSRLAGSGWVWWFYLGKALWPSKLMMVYPRWSVDPFQPQAWLPLLGLALLLVGSWWGRRRWGRGPTFALLAFTAALGPVLGLLTMYFARFSLVSDHLQYLALPAPLALLGASLGTLAHRPGWRRLTQSIAVALVVVLMLLTFRYARTFQDEGTMWAHNLAQDPQSWIAAHGVARQHAAAGRLDEAAVLFEQCLRGNPTYERAYVNLGLVRARQGHLSDARALFARAVELRPDYAQAHWYLGRALLDAGDLVGALTHLHTAAQLRPTDAAIQFELALALTRAEQFPEAVQQYERVLALAPDQVDARINLALALDRLGRRADAITHLRWLRQHHPRDVQAAQLLAQWEAH